jgi:hypothetical protein
MNTEEEMTLDTNKFNRLMNDKISVSHDLSALVLLMMQIHFSTNDVAVISPKCATSMNHSFLFL